MNFARNRVIFEPCITICGLMGIISFMYQLYSYITTGHYEVAMPSLAHSIYTLAFTAGVVAALGSFFTLQSQWWQKIMIFFLMIGIVDMSMMAVFISAVVFLGPRPFVGTPMVFTYYAFAFGVMCFAIPLFLYSARDPEQESAMHIDPKRFKMS